MEEFVAALQEAGLLDLPFVFDEDWLYFNEGVSALQQAQIRQLYDDLWKAKQSVSE